MRVGPDASGWLIEVPTPEQTSIDSMDDSEDVEALGSRSRPPVGVPIHEIALYEALDRCAARVFSPGAGRSTYFVSEPELGYGRPDAILLTISPASLSGFRRRELRLPSLNAAKSLTGEGSSLTERHARTLSRDLERAGWSERDLRWAAHMVADALAVEAKLSDWRRAIRQAAAYRVGTGRSAVLLPGHVGDRVDVRNLETHGVGLLLEDDRSVQWKLAAPRTEVSVSRRAWLVELLLRGLDSGAAHRVT